MAKGLSLPWGVNSYGFRIDGMFIAVDPTKTIAFPLLVSILFYFLWLLTQLPFKSALPMGAEFSIKLTLFATLRWPIFAAI